jgi:hypothetical protein
MPELTIGSVASPAPARRWNPLARVNPTWRAPLAAWLLSRVLVLLVVGIGSVWLGWPPMAPTSGLPRSLALLGGWDTRWYLRIAQHGYQTATAGIATHHSDFVFYPLLPAIMRIGVVTSSNPVLWGLAASNAALLVGLVAFHALTEDRNGLRFADRATWILAFSPAAVYASLAYSDGLLLALATCAAWAAWRGKWWLAAGLSALSVLARPQGLLVALLVVMIAVTAPAIPGRVRAARAVLAAVPALLVFGGFLLWMQLARGSWQLPFIGQQAWYRYSPGPRAIRQFGSEINYVFTYPWSKPHLPAWRVLYWTGPLRDLIVTVAMFALVVALIRFERSWRSVWVVFTVLALVVPLTSGDFSSETRFGLLAFPLIWPIAAWSERGAGRRVYGLASVGVVLIVALVLQIKYAYP